MIVGYYLRLRAMAFTWRVVVRVVRWVALAAVLLALAPVTLTAAIAYLAAWLRGWPPARLRRTAACCLPMLLAWLAALAVAAPRWPALGWAVPHAWHQAAHDAITGRVLAAAVLTIPAAVPLGLLAASWLWGWRIYAIETGLSGRTASAPAIFDARQWRRSSRSARARAAAPGSVPLTDTAGRIVVGTTIRAIGCPWRPVLAIPRSYLARHQVIIGSSGSGKTTLMLRLWAGWFALAWSLFTAGAGARPLLTALDCKGGRDARAKAERARRLLHAAGAQRVAIWPDEATLSLWALPPGRLTSTLFQMIESGEGAAAFYADVLAAAVRLAVNAPPGPPASAADFLARLAPGWLEAAYAADPAALARAVTARPHLGSVALRYETLFARLGPALDGPGQLQDADAWYFILEGTAEPSVAEAQALALTELVAHAATSAGPGRVMLLALDDYSAVSGKVPIWNLYERGRSLGLGVQVSAQSWDGLAPEESDRRRITSTADGGVWLLRTPDPEPLCKLGGTRQVVQSAHKLISAGWGDEGTSRLQHVWTVDPNIVRSLAPGQAAFIRGGSATWVHIARARPSPLALTATPAPEPRPRPGPGPAARPAPIALPGPPPPDGNLDDVFGTGSRP
ncbi:MAG TPA: hypothetical protein VGH27_12255 [Streptosporangiaceae bacterium]